MVLQMHMVSNQDSKGAIPEKRCFLSLEGDVNRKTSQKDDTEKTEVRQ
jgi:hypothetical protein